MSDDPNIATRPSIITLIRRAAPVKMPTDALGATMEVVCLMAAADGKLAEAEEIQLCATFGALLPGAGTQEAMRAVFARVMEELRRDGWETRVKMVAQRIQSAEERRNAYRLVAAVSFADGVVPAQEERLFAMLAEAFEIPRQEAELLLRDVKREMFEPVTPKPDAG